MQYVGQTKRTLGERFREHMRDIQKKSPKLLSVHLNSAGHKGIEDISISILSFIKQTPNSLSAQKARDRMEMFWYNQLGTMVPRGLNVEKTAKRSINSSSSFSTSTTIHNDSRPRKVYLT